MWPEASVVSARRPTAHSSTTMQEGTHCTVFCRLQLLQVPQTMSTACGIRLTPLEKQVSVHRLLRQVGQPTIASNEPGTPPAQKPPSQHAALSPQGPPACLLRIGGGC